MMLDQLTAEEEAGGEDSQGLFSPHTHTHCLGCIYQDDSTMLPVSAPQHPTP